MTAFGHNDEIIWAEGIKRMDLVLKDSVNSHAHKRPDPEKFFPTKVRMTLVQVSADAKYDPSLVPVAEHFKVHHQCSNQSAPLEGCFWLRDLIHFCKCS